jgi:hypothetical protein
MGSSGPNKIECGSAAGDDASCCLPVWIAELIEDRALIFDCDAWNCCKSVIYRVRSAFVYSVPSCPRPYLWNFPSGLGAPNVCLVRLRSVLQQFLDLSQCTYQEAIEPTSTHISSKDFKSKSDSPPFGG